jgi:acetate kinase
MTLLALNAGSSSLKLALFADDGKGHLFAKTVERVDSAAQSLESALEALAPHGGFGAVRAVGHRVVHGGESFTAATLVDDGVLEELRRLAALDPDHLPAEIAVIEAVRARAPSVPQVACFDTAFHAQMPRVAKLLAIPRAYAERGVRRYGFHGLSYQYLLEELARVAGAEASRGRIVFAHLGSGASLAAVRGGSCVDTTMSFTPNSGVPMGTRSGDLDPGVLAFLARTDGLSADELDRILNKKSGLAGVSGSSGDMRDLLAREATDGGAADAVALFCYSVTKAIGALATTIEGLDTLVFSAGIGERSAVVRAKICRGLAHLGVHLDDAKNDANASIVSSPRSTCTVRVIPTDEEAIIARETARFK